MLLPDSQSTVSWFVVWRIDRNGWELAPAAAVAYRCREGFGDSSRADWHSSIANESVWFCQPIQNRSERVIGKFLNCGDQPHPHAERSERFYKNLEVENGWQGRWSNPSGGSVSGRSVLSSTGSQWACEFPIAFQEGSGYHELSVRQG